MAVDPKNPHVWYVAMAAGGLWKTTNSGLTFTPVFDTYGSYSMCCVLVDPKNSSVVWLATGENTNLRSATAGEGVFKSTDAGATWRRVGLERSEKIGRMAIDPRNTDVVWVAAQGPLWSAGGDRGLYKTTDGGQTWKAVLQISENTGVTDVVLDPRNPDVVYAAAYQRRRHAGLLIGGGPEGGIYKSTDGGATFKKLVGRPSDRRSRSHWTRDLAADARCRLRVDHGARNGVGVLSLIRWRRNLDEAEQLEHERSAVLRRVVRGSFPVRSRVRARGDERLHERRRQDLHADELVRARRQPSHRLRPHRLPAPVVRKRRRSL